MQDFRRQISSINYYVDSLKVIEKDKRSLVNLDHIRMTLNDMDTKLTKIMREAEEDSSKETHAKIDEKFRIALATINSPNKEMVLASEKNNLVRQSVLGNNNMREAINRFKKAALAHEEKGQKKEN